MSEPYEYIFAVTRPGDRFCTFTSDDPAPVTALEAAVDDVLVEAEPGLWATPDRQSTVERLAWLPVGTLPEDHAGVGVPVAGAAT